MEVTERCQRKANAIERRMYYLTFPERRACQAMQGHMGKHRVWPGGRKEQRKPRLELSWGFPWERQGRAEETV